MSFITESPEAPFVLLATGVLAALVHPRYIVNYVAGGVPDCRRPATRNPLGRVIIFSLPVRGGVGVGFVGPISSAPSGISRLWLRWHRDGLLLFEQLLNNARIGER
ncbi:hypothetical protein DQ961_19025 [Salmonella bongori]|nr:hypothetical protein [Salmonella bongori]